MRDDVQDGDLREARHRVGEIAPQPLRGLAGQRADDHLVVAQRVPDLGERLQRHGVADDTVIPQEAGLNERAVSFTKGCYVGQETVARLYYRGKPNRRLLGLRLSEPVEPGTELKLGEKVVGKLGSVVVSPDHGPIALALVRREANPGDTVDLAGSTALIVDVPFAR